MSMSPSLKNYLDKRHINYNLLTHKHTDTSFNAAKSAHVPTEQMIKGVLLQDPLGCVMAAVPATREIDLRLINQKTGRTLEMVAEDQLANILQDCARGAVPAIGEAFGIDTLWDEALAFEPEFFIEAGDHQELVQISHHDFMQLMQSSKRATITH